MARSITASGTVVSIGDTVKVSQKIVEGEKERIQHFEGVVIAIKGSWGERTMALRRIGAGRVGIEKVFPVDLPSISSIKVLSQSDVRHSKLYFLRERKGKEALLLKPRSKRGKAEAHKKQKKDDKTKKASTTDEPKSGSPRRARRA